ncbi:splicing factor subunit 130kda, putative [Ichthyophthirius multifiliis]|uniref:Splicing factor subunit 130kda, putative n=1 Tax=Ichthyophthirius multifiliis TaxID=5932 RepID=G0QLD3_ICHMU|nr:splicing factor subunit 130kda, putative [Ichthyophthirius multifiliis]EGR33979.1 splicing factor subunit 130kda, putative [Ichthyophthirius multifiliis]|eukprot:XP_004039283.1 splicing factor subunit 130kda, putative [Ichthyophthirius multifiliis]
MMNLYSLTLLQPTCIVKAIYGNFSGPKAQELAVAKGKILEILSPDEETGKLKTVHSEEVFGLIRTISTFRLPGFKKDYIIIGSDSGRIVILNYNKKKGEFEKLHQETYGKTGCRRIVPGQYIAVDPKGRVCMIAALEKQKFVFILNRENDKLTISSPLEAHKSHTICYDICGIDVGYENAQFACIECDYGEKDQKDSPMNNGIIQKQLTIYELDFGLNHVVKKSSENVPESAHLLISIPGGQEGPGGVVIVCEDFLIYKGTKGERICQFPKRFSADTNSKIMINTFGFHKQKEFFFFLLQTELGDLFKLEIQSTKDDVHSISLQYFDSIPPSISICVMRNGYLFAACEKGNHLLYRFKSIGEKEANSVRTDSTQDQKMPVLFIPRKLKNLQQVDQLENLSAISDIKVSDLTGEGHPQIYTLCSAGYRSSLRILRHGLQVNEVAASRLPGVPTGIWTIKSRYDENFSKYIILSFSKQTLVLSISDRVQQVTDSGIDLNKQTIHANLLEDNAIIQVMPDGFRHIRVDKRVQQLKTEGKIVKAVSNQKQIAISLQGGDIIYFELDYAGQLIEVAKTNLQEEIECMDIGEVPFGRQKSKFLSVGCSDHSVRILSLENDTCLQKISIQALPGIAENVSLIEMKRGSGLEQEAEQYQLYLYVGLKNGILLRASVDQITGSLSDTRTRVLSGAPVRTCKYQVQGQPALLALKLIHKTEVDDIPGSLHAHKGKLLAGCGTFLRYYDIGKKKLLKKSEVKGLQSPINGIQTFGDRIFVSMVGDAVHIMKHKQKEQTFYEVCDDVLPRWMSAFQVLDYSTYIGGDKFENMFVCRIPQNAEEEMDENPMSYKLRWESGYLNGAPYKTEQICQFYVGEVVTTFQKACLVSTGNECIIYGTSMGSIGAFYPFQTKEDIDFFVHLEMYLRIDVLPLAGRDHVMFRAFYGPVKSVIDGDLCEQFMRIGQGKQKVLAEEMERTPAEVHKKLDEIRNKIL